VVVNLRRLLIRSRRGRCRSPEQLFECLLSMLIPSSAHRGMTRDGGNEGERERERDGERVNDFRSEFFRLGK